MSTVKHPQWFALDPNGPHQRSGGLGDDGYSYEFYCAKDGQRWPCDEQTQRQRHEQHNDHRRHRSGQ